MAPKTRSTMQSRRTVSRSTEKVTPRKYVADSSSDQEESASEVSQKSLDSEEEEAVFTDEERPRPGPSRRSPDKYSSSSPNKGKAKKESSTPSEQGDSGVYLEVVLRHGDIAKTVIRRELLPEDLSKRWKLTATLPADSKQADQARALVPTPSSKAQKGPTSPAKATPSKSKKENSPEKRAASSKSFEPSDSEHHPPSSGESDADEKEETRSKRKRGQSVGSQTSGSSMIYKRRRTRSSTLPSRAATNDDDSPTKKAKKRAYAASESHSEPEVAPPSESNARDPEAQDRPDDATSDDEMQSRRPVTHDDTDEVSETHIDELDSEHDSFIVSDGSDAPLVRLPSRFSLSRHQGIEANFENVCKLFIELALRSRDSKEVVGLEDIILEHESYGIAIDGMRRVLGGWIDSCVAGSSWLMSFRDILSIYPELSVVIGNDLGPERKKCFACRLKTVRSEIIVTVTGTPYGRDNFEPLETPKSPGDHQEQGDDRKDPDAWARFCSKIFAKKSTSQVGDDESEGDEFKTTFVVGQTCVQRVMLFHRLMHWERKLYTKFRQGLDRYELRTDDPLVAWQYMVDHDIIANELKALEDLQDQAYKLK